MKFAIDTIPTDSGKALLIAGIAALTSVTAVLLTAFATYSATKRDRRRTLYGEALKAALGWQEMLYRVRRRREEDGPCLVKQFHDLQEQLIYYQGLIGSESRPMEESYRRLVKTVKSGTEPLITQAWSDNVRAMPGNAMKGDQHPEFTQETERFLRDVRSHLSAQPWRKVAPFWRNRGQVT